MDLSEAIAVLKPLHEFGGPLVEGEQTEALRTVLASLTKVSAFTEEWEACDEHGNPLMEGYGEAAGELRGLGF